MPRDFLDPTPEEQAIVLIQYETISIAEGFIKSCEHCNPDGAEWPFNVILDRVTGSDPSVTDYILEMPASARTASARSSKRLSLSLRECHMPNSKHISIQRCVDFLLRGSPLEPEEHEHLVHCFQ